jgi:hypothetical protein
LTFIRQCIPENGGNSLIRGDESEGIFQVVGAVAVVLEILEVIAAYFAVLTNERIVSCVCEGSPPSGVAI